MVRTVHVTSVSDVRLGVMNVSSLVNKMDCVIDHITDNKLDIVGITETWLSNNDKNNMLVMNTCLDSGYPGCTHQSLEYIVSAGYSPCYIE